MAQLDSVCVTSLADQEPQPFRHAVPPVDPLELAINPPYAVLGKNRILVGVLDEQRLGRDERGQGVIIPPIGVHDVHAIAVPPNNAIDHGDSASR